MHEAACHDVSSFVTLTIDGRLYPEFARSLDGPVPDRPGRPGKPGLFALFMKRLRERRERESVRSFHAGEYGEKNARPHYHALLFGVGFADRVESGRRHGVPVFRSAELEELWPYGRSEIGSVTFESAQYLAKYCVKKASRGGRYSFGDDREAEYITMSRRPGIGARWVERFRAELVKFGTVMLRGVEVDAPRFYLDQLTEAQREVCAARRARKYGVEVDGRVVRRVPDWRERAAREVLAVAKLRMAEEARACVS